MTQDSVSPAPRDDAEELSLGGTDRARAANEAVRALARAARSYTIYDPRNDAIRGFLEDVRARFDVVLKGHGELDLQVRPYELTLDGDVVYLDRDRERSLAFKLYRDGVRRLRIEEGMSWHELTQLLGVLSMRYVGIHQNPAEDDMVTLLWKAGFQHIHVDAIEGFIPEEDVDGGAVAVAGGDAGALTSGVRFPPDFDLPAPELGTPELPKWGPLDPEDLASLLAENDNTHLAQLVVAAVEALTVAALDPVDMLTLDDVLPLVRDARGLLLTEEHVPALIQVAATLWSLAQGVDEEQARAIEPVVESMLGPAGFARVLKSVSAERVEVSESLLLMLANLRGDATDTLLDLLDSERGLATRRVLRQLLEMQVEAHGERLIERFGLRSGGVAADLLRVLAKADPERATPMVPSLAQQDDLELQLEFLVLVKDMPRGATTRALLVHMLHAPSAEVRQRTLEVIVEMGEAGAYLTVQRHAETLAERRADLSDLEAAGDAMARLAPTRALEAFRGWVRPKGFFGRLIGQGKELRRAALTGLKRIDDPEAELLLELLTKQGDEDEQDLARRALGGWRRQRGVVR